MPRRKKLDLFALILFEVLAVALSLLFELTFLPSTLLFLGVPTLYLAVRLTRRTQWHRIIAMALVFGVWYGFLFAYIADWNKAWAWPEPSLPWGHWFSVLNPVEWLWVFLWVTLIVIFYEHFLEHDRAKKVSRRIIWAIVPACLITLAVFAFTMWRPTALEWPYAYAVLALLTLPPAAVLLWRRPHVFPKIALSVLFFVPVHIAHEITGLLLDHWQFPGQYFLMLPMPGGTAVPIEEFVIWITLGSILVLSYYELYIDDEK